MSQSYDAVLVVSFGGPEGPDEVMPFLENVLRGKNVPRERMLAVAEHYQHFGGRSPINGQNRALIAALEAELAAQGPRLPVYLGNRNWHPLLADTLAEMGRRGVRRALALFTSAYSSYSGCRQYLENIADAQRQVGAAAPEVHKLRAFFNHPRFIAAQVDRVRAAWEQIPPDRRAATPLIFTAHSIPQAMTDGCDYAAQLNETGRLIAERLAGDAASRPQWDLAYQSRSGPPSQPWLEPDIGDRLRQVHAAGQRDVVVAPIGFLSDHMEVLYDLDTEARELAGQLGLNLVRAATVGKHPEVIAMIRELIVERMTANSPRPALGQLGPRPDECPANCCPAGKRPEPPAAASRPPAAR
ncbi:MAG TPA: ferrochelatase [Pirellulales bacterium]|jgi:ferrochelatase